MFSRSQSTSVRRGQAKSVANPSLFWGITLPLGLALCHNFMFIVCFSASQLKPDVGYPSQLKGESNSHPLAGLRACCSPLCTVPRGFVDLLICSVLSWKVINSNGTPAFVWCLQTFCFFGIFTLQTELPETKPTCAAFYARIQHGQTEQQGSSSRPEVRRVMGARK